MEDQEQQKRQYRVFKHVNKSAQYVFGTAGISGQTAVFIEGIYYTADPEKIAELNKVCIFMEQQAKEGRGVRYIYIDPEFAVATEAELDPEEAKRKALIAKTRAELLKELEEAGRLVKDAGNYATPQTIIAAKTLAGNPVQSNSGARINPVKVANVPVAHEIVK